MGCDGGTIPTRDELVKTKKKPEQKDKEAALAAQWNNCALTQQHLVPPMVSCQLGYLYNKEGVIEYLLDRSKFEGADKFSHIKSLKHIKELSLTANPGYEEVKDKGNGYVNTHMSPYSCPVVGFEMNGRYKFCYLWSCGCVISERALKEVQSDRCHKCTKPYKTDDIVVLNADKEDMENNVRKMEERRKSSKKVKRSAKEAGMQDNQLANTTSSKKSCTTDCDRLVPASNGSSTESSSARSTKAHKPGKAAPDKGPTSSNGSTKYKSIQHDPKASKALKSLFTSSEKGKTQASGHWVTFNPQYY